MILHLCRVVKIIFFENWIFECLPQKLGSKFFGKPFWLKRPLSFYFLLLSPTSFYFLLHPRTSSYQFLSPIFRLLISYGLVLCMVWFGTGGWRGVISYLVSSYMKRFQCYSAQKSFMGGGGWWWWRHCNYSYKLQVQVSY